MYRSLYSVLKPIIDSKSTGALTIVHYSNERGIIHFSSGSIVRIRTNEFQGTKAAEKIFAWVSFLAQFKEKKLKLSATSKNIKQTEKILAYLARIDKIVKKIISTMEGCETVLRLTKSGIDSIKNFTPDEQSIAFSIDGEKTVIEILIKAEISELELLLMISNFVDKGFAEVVKFHEPVSADESNRFFTILIDVLSDITGPVGEILVDKVCDAMGMEREDLCVSDTGPVLSFIREKLDEDEQDALNARDIVEQTFQG